MLVMPMYNGGFTAPLKNALDYLHAEWRDKPVGFVSYSGGASGGTGAVEMIRPVVGRLGMVPAGTTLAVPYIDQHIDADGRFAPGEGMGEAVAGLLDELVRLTPRSAAA